MSYLDDNDPELIEDLILRKEFYWTKKWNIHRENKIQNFIPKFLLQESIKHGVRLKAHSYQIFIENLINPNTPYKRLLLLWDTGIGKTIASLLSAMKFIDNFRLESESGNKEIGSVFIIGFSKKVFINDLLRFPEFGFLSRDEKTELERLKKISLSGSLTDIENYKEKIIKIKKRLTNRKGNGFFKFYGYKEFVNRIFIQTSRTDLTNMTEEQIKDVLKNGTIKYNHELLNEFKNSLIICDEIHNVYNSLEKNNWGIAIQSVLDKEPTCKAIFMSATPINNSPTEIIDLINLLVPIDQIKNIYGSEHLKREDFFKSDGELKNNALESIKQLCRGRISFVKDTNPQYFPELKILGDNIPTVSYLKFIRCPMTKFHYKTYSAIYKGTLSQDSQYLMDFVLPNPDDENIGIYQSNQIEKIALAPQSWKNKNNIDYVNNKIVGDICHYDNLKKYSSKYTRLLEIIQDIIENKKGKICIYHNVVHKSGILFIAEVLLRNGILDENMPISDNTLCIICGKQKKDHGSINIKDNNITKNGGTITKNGGTINIKETLDFINSNSPESNLINAKDKKKLSMQLSGNSHYINADNYTDENYTDENYTDDNYTDENYTDENYTDENYTDENYTDENYTDEYRMNNLVEGGNNTFINKIYNTKFDKLNTEYDKLNTEYDNVKNNIKNNIKNKSNSYINNNLNKVKNYFNEIISDPNNINKFYDKYKNLKYTNNNINTDENNENNDNNNTNDNNENNEYENNEYDNNINENNDKIGGAKSIPHEFKPVRFIIVHGEIDKTTMDHSIEKFNNIDNVWGDNFLILLGSKVIKESIDIKAIQNMIITRIPDNIQTLIQIKGRAVRKNSHIGLPAENNIVNLMILTTSLPDNYDIRDFKQLNDNVENKNYTKLIKKNKQILSYEEDKYRDKINVFKTIQEIEKTLHENAVDSIINKEIIKFKDNNREIDPLAPLPYEPDINKKYDKEFRLDELRLDTFNIYYNKKEINIIKTIIKQLFIEISTIWRYDDLFNAVKNPNIFNPNYNPKNKSSGKFISFENDINTELFNEGNFIIALNQLMWVPDESNGLNNIYIPKKHDNKESSNNTVATVNFNNINLLDKIFNPNDKIINIPNSNKNYIITPLYDYEMKYYNKTDRKNEINFKKQNFYMLLPMNNINIPRIDIELPYRILNNESKTIININSFVQNKKEDFDYDDKKIIFINKWKNISIENMENAICEYGTAFHIKLIEECIEYIFNAWTSPTIIKSDNHEFYFKMLYYYDLLQLVIWAYTCKPKIFNNYTKYAIPFKAKDIKLKALEKYEKAKDYEAEEKERKNARRREIRQLEKKGKSVDKYKEKKLFKNIPIYSDEDISPADNSDLNSNGIINLLKSSINNSSNVWIPENFRTMYNDILKEVDNLFDDRKKKNKYINKVLAKYLPIGHYINKFPTLYIPELGWKEDASYSTPEQEFIENNLVVGYDEKSKTGIHIRFKLRKPIHTIKKFKDIRLIEKGTVCKSKSKSDLKKIAISLNAEIPDKINTDELCSLIRTKLIRAELKERIAKSKIKYFYFHYEERPDIIND